MSITRSDSVRVKRQDDYWFAEFAVTPETLSGRRLCVWGTGSTPFAAVDDLSEALSDMAQVLSGLPEPA